jgi:hypothetical protein
VKHPPLYASVHSSDESIRRTDGGNADARCSIENVFNDKYNYLMHFSAPLKPLRRCAIEKTINKLIRITVDACNGIMSCRAY